MKSHNIELIKPALSSVEDMRLECAQKLTEIISVFVDADTLEVTAGNYKPIIEHNDNLGTMLEKLVTTCSTDPERPFEGQDHTDQGVRGTTKIHGVRFRDLADCMAKAFAYSMYPIEGDPASQALADKLREKADDNTLEYNDLFGWNLDDMSPIAVIQNLCVEVEKIMGIYPNTQQADRVKDPVWDLEDEALAPSESPVPVSSVGNGVACKPIEGNE